MTNNNTHFGLILQALGCWLLSAIFFQLASAEVHKEPMSFAPVLPTKMESLGYINDINQDRFGFMWFAGSSGLARYDGYQLRFYAHIQGDPSTPPHTSITHSYVATDGQLWLTSAAGLSVYREAFDNFHTYSEPNRDWATNPIEAIVEAGSQGFWLGARSGLLYFDRVKHSFEEIPFTLPRMDEFDNRTIWDIAKAADGSLWLATDRAGLVHFDPQSRLFQTFDLGLPDLVSSLDLRTVFVDREDRLWVGSFTGELFMLPTKQASVIHFQRPDDHTKEVIWSIDQDPQGRIWVGDGGGLNLVDLEPRKLIRYQHDPDETKSLSGFAVRKIFYDRNDDLWLGFFPAGIDQWDKFASIFRNFSHRSETNSVTEGGVLAVVEDPQQNLWIGAGRGLSYFKRASQTFLQYPQDFPGAETLQGGAVISLLLDRNQHLWVGNWSKGLDQIHLPSGRVNHFFEIIGDDSSVLGFEHWGLIEDREGDIWVASEKGISRYLQAEQRFQRYKPQDLSASGQQFLTTRILIQDRQGDIWVGSDRGLYRIRKSTGEFVNFLRLHQQKDVFKGDLIRAITEDSRGELWVGTHSGGLYQVNRTTGTTVSVAYQHKDTGASITAIVEDVNGVIWCTTLNGAFKLDPHSGETRRLSAHQGLLDNLFNRNASTSLTNGELFLGSAKGFTLFDPRQLQVNHKPPEVVFTDLKVLNQVVNIGGLNSPLPQSLLVTETIIFKPWQNIFAFEFAALDYHQPETNQFAYKLEGFDKHWHWVGTQHTATYTNLNPGDYLLRVRAANGDGVWSVQDATMKITVLPDWWRTWWAYAIYCAAVVAVVTTAILLLLKYLELSQTKRINLKLRRLDKIKDTFLANTSHELRTPLNSMIGLTDVVLSGTDGPVSNSMKQKLNMIRTSAKRLASLVNDILDYAKLNEHSLEIRLRPADLNSLLRDAVYLMRPLAEAKGLKLTYVDNEQLPWIMCDENRVQQILINLLGNAIKFTDQGAVTVTAHNVVGRVRVAIQDTGIGIAEDDLSSVFLAFHQLDSQEQQETVGTGLGLAITKQLIELQGGHLGVSSELGKGSCFWFELKQSANAVRHRSKAIAGDNSSSQYCVTPPSEESVMSPRTVTATEAEVPMIEHPEHYRILIVDDDAVNRMVLRSMLEQHHYQVVEANNGQLALDRMNAKPPIHLVLLDVMMPGLNGFEVCTEIRQHHSLMELPILFLTGHKNDLDLQTGFAVGGNEFLTKPVSRFELMALVANYLRVVNLNSRVVKTDEKFI